MAASPVTIYSEQPFEDIWLRLLRFTYEGNLGAHRVPATGKELAEDAQADIAACIQQAHEYFRAAIAVSLHTSTLQLYYGMISLLKAMTILVKGDCGTIRHHGMKVLIVPNDGRIGGIELQANGADCSGLREYASALLSIDWPVGVQTWSLAELLGSIPELFEEHSTAYGPSREVYSVPVERLVISSSQVADRVDLGRVPTFTSLISLIPNFDQRYLSPQQTRDNFVVLRPKLRAFSDLAYVSLSGSRFLLVAHSKDGQHVTLPPLLSMFMTAFILGYLSRYHARFWSAFVTKSRDDEKHLIEMFVRLCLRLFPNTVLDTITGSRHIFSPARSQDTDLRDYAVVKDIKDIISKEVASTLQDLVKGSRE